MSHALRFAQAVWTPGAVHALRVLYKGKPSVTFEGLFESPEDLARAAVEASTVPRPVWAPGEGERPRLPTGVYLVPNPAHPALTSRSPVGVLESVGDGGIKDHEALSRRCFLVDVDALRPVNEVSATDAERAQALELAATLRDACLARGWPEPIQCVSGNGAHLVWLLDEPNTPQTHALIQGALMSLSDLVEPGARADKRAQVDQTVHNASRLWRMPGTWARKGKDDGEGGRPHRLAQIARLPDWGEQLMGADTFPGQLGAELLRALIEEVKAPDAIRLIGVEVPKAKPSPSSSAPSKMRGAAAPLAQEEVVDQAIALALEHRAAWIPAALAAISPEVKRGAWLAVGVALYSLMGDAEGFALWDSWSAAGSGYKASEMPGQWRSLEKRVEPEGDACKALWGQWGSGSFKAWRKAHGLTLPCEERGEEARPKRAPKPKAMPIAPPSAPRLPEDTSLIHPLAPLWHANMPEWIYQQTAIGVAAGVHRQLSLAVAPVCVGHRVLSCDPATSRWHQVSEGDVARILARWVARVGLTEVSDSEVTRYYNGGGGGSGKIFGEVQARVHDITQLQAKVGQQLVLGDAVLRIDWREGRVVHEQLAPTHYAIYGYDFPLHIVESAEAPRWHAYLDGLFEGSEDAARRIEYFKRWAAMAVFGATIQLQAPALVLKGKAGTGKSTAGNIIALLMPPDSTTSVPMEQWGNEYYRAELVGKLLNFVPEMAIDEPVGDLDEVKKIIFGERTSAREIRQKPVKFYPRAAHIFCGNGLPNLKKADPAVFKRFAHLEVTGRVVRGTKDDDTRFAQRLIEDELPGILRDLVAAMGRALDDNRDKTPGTANGLPLLASSEATNEAWRGKSNAVALYLGENWDHHEGLPQREWPTLMSVFKTFKLWCDENNFSQINRETFKTLLSYHYDIAVVGKQDRVAYARPRVAMYEAEADEGLPRGL